MTILITLGPLLLALLFGYWIRIKFLSEKTIQISLAWLTYLILAMIGVTIGALDDLSEKLATAGTQALVFFGLISLFSIVALGLTGHYFNPESKQSSGLKSKKIKFHFGIFADAFKTLIAVVVGVIFGIFAGKELGHLDAFVTYLLYLLLFLIGHQLQQGNYR